MDEIEDAVSAWVQAGDERRPGDRALRRNRSAEALVVPLRSELGERGELPGGHEAVEQVRVDAVEAEDQHAMPRGRGGLRAPGCEGEEYRDERRSHASSETPSERPSMCAGGAIP